MKTKIYNKRANYIATILAIINVLLFIYQIIKNYNDVAKMILSIGIPFLLLSIIVFSYKKFMAYTEPQQTKLIQRTAMLAMLGLVFINFQIVFNEVLTSKVILTVIFLINIFCLFILYMKSFSSKANNYDSIQLLKENKKQLSNAMTIIAVCIVVNAIFVFVNSSDMQHVVLSIFFLLPLVILKYIDQLNSKKKFHYIILLTVLILMLVFIVFVAYTNKIATLAFSIYFILVLALLLSSLISLKLFVTKKE